MYSDGDVYDDGYVDNSYGSPGANIIRQALRVNSSGMINGYDDGLITNSYGIIFPEYLFFQPKQEYNDQADYWWLRSPNTWGDNVNAFLIISEGVTYSIGIYDSYGHNLIFALRIVMVLALRILSTQTVAPAIYTTSVSCFPTDNSRSPRTARNDHAFSVTSDGHVDGVSWNVTYSYGLAFSPYTGIPGVYLVFDSGNVPDHDNNFKNSYGTRSPNTDYDDRAYLVNSSGGDYGNHVDRSYGKKRISPSTNYDAYTYYVRTSGDVYEYVSSVYNNSYGLSSISLSHNFPILLFSKIT